MGSTLGAGARPFMAVVSALLLASGCTDASENGRGAAGSQEGELTAATGEWRPLAAPAPHVPSLDAPVAWTGDQAIVWGTAGPNPNPTGASYDPALDRWEDLPPAPIGTRSEHSAVWTGEEVIFWGRSPEGAGPRDGTAAGAAYQPDSKTWRVLPDAPISDRVAHQAVWSGKEMVIWGGRKGNTRPHHGALHASDAAAYDPVKDAWRKLPDVPDSWTGEGGEPLTVVHRGRVFIYRAGLVATLSTDGNGWEKFGDRKPATRAPTSADRGYGGEGVKGAVSGGDIYVWSGEGGRYSGHAMSTASGEWRKVADTRLPGHPFDLAAGRGSLYAASNREGKVAVFRYDIARDRWEDLRSHGLDIAPGPEVIWTGEQLLVINGYRINDGPRSGAAFGPRSRGAAR